MVLKGRMPDNPRAAAHRITRRSHPSLVMFENIFELSA
jgi:hypothetical protein